MSTYPLTADGVAAALAALGDTPDHIADTLYAGGYRGHRGDECCCPLSRYLLDVTDAIEVHVWSDGPDPDYVEAFRNESPDGTPFYLIKVPLSEPLSRFLYRFDCEGAYPDLDVDEAGAS
jgi:hypothetical protein